MASLPLHTAVLLSFLRSNPFLRSRAILAVAFGLLATALGRPSLQAQPSFVAVGEGGVILTSPDGATWTSRVSGTAARLRAATAKSGTLIVVGQAGTVLTSPDGITWTSIVSGIPEGLRGVAASASLAVAVGGQTTGRIFTSPDAVTWTEVLLGTPAGALRGIAYDGTRFAAVGAGGSILTSTDGATWVARTSGTAERLDGIVWTGSAFEVISTTASFSAVPTAV